MRQLAPRFVQILRASLIHWQQSTANLDDALIIEIDPNRRNLHQPIEMGLTLEETYALASDVALQTFFLAERRGYWAEWADLLQLALSQAYAIAPEKKGLLLNRLGELYRLAYRLDDALAVHKQAEALALAEDNMISLAAARYRLCWDYLAKLQYAEAEACCRFAIDTFTQYGVREDLLTNCYWALGNLARRRGDFILAQEHLAYAVNLGRTTQQPTHQARIIIELALALVDAEAYDEALLYFAEAEQILQATASERDKVNVQLNRGLVFYRRKQWVEAELTFRQAINSSYLRDSGDVRLQALLANNLGNSLLKQEDWDEAEAQLDYARQLWLELKEDVPLANSLGTLAKFRVRRSEIEEAILFLKQAIELVKPYPEDAFARQLLKEFEAELRRLEEEE